MHTKLDIVFATQKDIPTILQLIKELAKYEKLESEVVATEKMLTNTLFGEKRYAEVILGLAGNEVTGFALFFHNYSTFLSRPGIYLEDLFVKKEHRGKGYGKSLLKYIAQVAIDRDCGRIEWCVLNWNQPAIEFYQSIGASHLDEWNMNRISGDGIKKLASP